MSASRAPADAASGEAKKAAVSDSARTSRISGESTAALRIRSKVGMRPAATSTGTASMVEMRSRVGESSGGSLFIAASRAFRASMGEEE